jgi:hypothetical protein
MLCLLIHSYSTVLVSPKFSIKCMRETISADIIKKETPAMAEAACRGSEEGEPHTIN